MFNHYKMMKNAKDTDLESMFGGIVKTVDVPKQSRAVRSALAVKNLILFVVVSCLAGVILSVYPLMAISGAVQLGEPVAEYWKSLPEELENVDIGQRNVLYDVNGDVFAEVWVENRIQLDSLDEISDYAKDALIATEDKRFYEHGGFDAMGTLRALTSGSGGGSGITQQLVKNLQFYNLAGRDKQSESVEHTLDRKLRELKMSMSYEEDHSKDEILLTYFNTVAFGGPSTYSIEAASRYYFDKSAKDLSLAEASVLIGSVQNPTVFDLSSDKTDAYKYRQYAVLSRMVAEEHITQEEADAAYVEPLNLVFKKTSSGNCASSKYPFYCEYVLDSMMDSDRLAETPEERDAILKKGGLHIKTYLDPVAMDIVDAQLEKDYGNLNRVVVPVAVVEPGTGGVNAIAVNRDYGEGEGQTNINFPLNKAGTGSAYKLFTLAAALNNGYSESDLTFSSKGCPLIPGPNYDSPPGGFKNSTSCELQGGLMDYKQATAYSSNTWYVTLEMDIGVEAVKEFSRSVGLEAPDGITSRSLSYTLGPVENDNIQMAAAYATFANEGVYCPATPVISYEYADGTSPVIPDTYDPASDSCRRVMSPYSAGIVLKAMKATISGEIEGAFGLPMNIKEYSTAAKSGTNQLYNSSWAHLTGNYSVFANLYDPIKLTNGVDNIVYQGRNTIWYEHVSGFTARDITKQLIDYKGYERLNYNSRDKSLTPVEVDSVDYFTIPSVLGMEPPEALSVLNSLGVTAHVSKDTVSSPPQYPTGVIAEQSVVPGTQLPVGSKKEIILYASE